MPRPISYAVFCLKKKIHSSSLPRSGDVHERLHSARPSLQPCHRTVPRTRRCCPLVLPPRRRLGHPYPRSRSSPPSPSFLFFFNDTATTEIYTLSLHDALPIFRGGGL